MSRVRERLWSGRGQYHLLDFHPGPISWRTPCSGLASLQPRRRRPRHVSGCNMRESIEFNLWSTGYTPAAATIHLANIGFPPSRLALETRGFFPSIRGNVQCGDGVTLASGAIDPSPCDLMSVDHNLRYPYVHETGTLVSSTPSPATIALEVGDLPPNSVHFMIRHPGR